MCFPALLTAAVLAACEAAPGPPANTDGAPVDDDPVARGEYLARVGGCHDCHTPKQITGSGPVEDTTRMLAGASAATPVPEVPEGVIGPESWGALGNHDLTVWAGPWGVSFAANLTPDSTGIGTWTAEEFLQAMRNGLHRGSGRPILPPMPWQNIAQMSDADLEAIFAYLQSIPPVQNAVPAPRPPAGGAAPQEVPDSGH